MRKKVLIVDDNPEYIEMLYEILSEYEVFAATSGESGLELAQKISPEIILLDIKMPGIDGYEVCKRLKADTKLCAVPVIFLTASEDFKSEEEGFVVGAVDFISKPFNATLLRARVKTHLNLYSLQSNLQQEVEKSVGEIKKLNNEIIMVTASVAEVKSKETGLHLKRVSKISCELAKYMGKNNNEAKMIRMASILHDIGKVGISERIISKPGKLDPDEWEIIKTHSELGYNMLKNSELELMKLAATIALEHHERWDGSGYPKGLREEEISFEGRLVAVADVFDSLFDERVYKKPWLKEEVEEYFRKMSGIQFDPKITQVLLDNFEEMIKIRVG